MTKLVVTVGLVMCMCAHLRSIYKYITPLFEKNNFFHILDLCLTISLILML